MNMKHKELKSEGLKKEFEIEVSAALLTKLQGEKLSEYGQKAKIPGFRPGKIPAAILEQRYGQQVAGEVLETSVDQSVRDFFTKNDALRPAQQPNIEVSSYEPGKKLTFKLSFESLPEIKVTEADIKKIKVEKQVAKIDDKEINEALENVRKGSKINTPITGKRASKQGDVVLINFDGSVDGEKIDGMKGENYELELGTKSFIDTFEDQIEGKKAGDKFDVTVTFPKEYHEPKLSGREALFHVDLLEIREATEAKLDDALAEKNGFKTLDELKEAIKKKLEEEYANLSKIKMKQKILDHLADAFKFEIPKTLLDGEIEQIKKMEGQTPEAEHVHGPDCDHDHDDKKDKKKAAPKKDSKEDKDRADLADRRVRLGLLLSEIGNSHKIDVSQQEMTQAMFSELRNYPGHEKEMLEMFKKNPKLMENFRGPILENKVMDYIIEHATVTEKKVKIEELTKE